jgi:hypothetical protein
MSELAEVTEDDADDSPTFGIIGGHGWMGIELDEGLIDRLEDDTFEVY